METRNHRGSVNLRAAGEGQEGPGTIAGYGAVFYREGDAGTEFRLWEDVVERVAPGAFVDSIAADDVRGLFNHNPNFLLGRSGAGTARATEDQRGLAYEIDLPDTQAGRDVAEMVNRGDLYGSSFSFDVTMESWERRDDGIYVRTLERAKLYDYGPVTFPAYEGTSVTGRAGDQVPTRDELVELAERYLHPKSNARDYYRARAILLDLN